MGEYKGGKTGAEKAQEFRDWNRNVGPGEASVRAAQERRAWQHEHSPGPAKPKDKR